MVKEILEIPAYFAGGLPVLAIAILVREDVIIRICRIGVDLILFDVLLTDVLKLSLKIVFFIPLQPVAIYRLLVKCAGPDAK